MRASTVTAATAPAATATAGWKRREAAIVGGVLTVTGLTQKRPVNQLLGVDTYREVAREEDAERPDIGERPA